MPYYVVNAGRGRSTHIMKSSSSYTPGMVSSVVTGFVKVTLCGLQATRYVDVFQPSEASCRECKKRWQIAMAKEAARANMTPEQKQRESNISAVVVLLILILAAVIGAVIGALHH